MDIEGNTIYAAAIEEIRTLLDTYWPDKPKHGQVDIYTWPDHSGTQGLRVAEVSLSAIDPATGTGGGGSWMQSDVECGNVIFHVERAILEVHHYPEDPDEHEVGDLFEAKWRVIFAVHGEEAAKQFEGA